MLPILRIIHFYAFLELASGYINILVVRRTDYVCSKEESSWI